jgi:hypothetical protein
MEKFLYLPPIHIPTIIIAPTTLSMPPTTNPEVLVQRYPVQFEALTQEKVLNLKRKLFGCYLFSWLSFLFAGLHCTLW